MATVPRVCLGHAAAVDGAAKPGLQSFALPFRLPEIIVSALWHPRMEADPAHRWLRHTVVEFCKKLYPSKLGQPRHVVADDPTAQTKALLGNATKTVV